MTPCRWLLINGGVEAAGCLAETKTDAVAVLAPRGLPEGAYVTSAASHAIGVPREVARVLAAGPRVCERCEQRPRADGGRYCLPCKAAAEGARRVVERDRIAARRAVTRNRARENAARRARRRLARGGESE